MTINGIFYNPNTIEKIEEITKNGEIIFHNEQTRSCLFEIDKVDKSEQVNFYFIIYLNNGVSFVIGYTISAYRVVTEESKLKIKSLLNNVRNEIINYLSMYQRGLVTNYTLELKQLMNY